ncbi:hypothetical protein FIBSPDRAFT_886333 [Athelia psychrophila]|uniref:Uncharacterized protein n=1 Tax=Athelia psychrophila TaxID=1759441 RepID=A0A166R146_9AGAM|nr:hypothetical protein FIBSPDRAFT_886333 [Fibularhizoctonia sp. CBS 109695]
MLQYGDPVHSLPIKPDFRPVDLRQNKQDPKQNPRTSLSSGRHLGDLVRDRRCISDWSPSCPKDVHKLLVTDGTLLNIKLAGPGCAVERGIRVLVGSLVQAHPSHRNGKRAAGWRINLRPRMPGGFMKPRMLKRGLSEGFWSIGC